jgi:hypothetical protein
MTRSPVRSVFVHLLPALHLCACLSIALAGAESAWRYLFWIDAPASAFILALAYNHDRPLILFGTIGTLWWYLVSFAVWFCWTRLSTAIRNRRTPRTEATTR